MGRHLIAALVVVADTALLVAGHRGGPALWAVMVYALTVALVVALVVALRHWAPVAAFVAALALAALTGGAYVLLIWAAYHAGRGVASRSGAITVAVAALGGLVGQLAARPADPQAIPHLVSTYLVFVALPLLAGRYLAQHQRLVAALGRHNRQLRWKQELLAEQERLRERLRIAREMHDSLGRRLSIVSVQAAALEVSALPPQQRQAARALAGAARGATDELHQLVGALRGAEETPGRSPGAEAIAAVVEQFQVSGVPVTLRQRGKPRPLSTAAGHAAYRVVEEGLTNAAKHAPGQPVAVSVEWEADALLLTVVNPLPDGREAAPAVAPVGAGAGYGLSGLSERVRPAGGLLDYRPSARSFRLFAMLPTVWATYAEEEAAGAAAEDSLPDDLPAVERIRTVALGFATGALMFVVLPVIWLAGVG